MAVPDLVSVEDAQQYYETTDRIRLKPGWMQGEGQPLPVMEPYSGVGLKWSHWS